MPLSWWQHVDFNTVFALYNWFRNEPTQINYDHEINFSSLEAKKELYVNWVMVIDCDISSLLSSWADDKEVRQSRSKVVVLLRYDIYILLFVTLFILNCL